MLKRLWKRDSFSEEKAAADLLATVMPAAAKPVAEQAVPTADAVAPKRKPKGMRDSDIIDEDGKSAEEIAAEAAQEFDIMGLAKRVADMPDVIPPASEAPAKPVAKAAPADEGPKFTARTTPLAAADPTRKPEQASAAPEPVAPPVASAPVAAVAMSAPQAEVFEDEDGHIAFPGFSAASQDETFDARDIYWDQIGDTDPDLLSVAPKTGTSSWPSGRQIFRLVRTGNSLIIASDGLSDPFEQGAGPADCNGFGLEAFIEIPGWQDVDADRVKTSWAFRAIEAFCKVVVRSGGLADTLARHGVLSLELPAGTCPPKWSDPSQTGKPGALVGVPRAPGLTKMQGMPLSTVAVVPLTLLHAEEVAACIEGGKAERQSLATDLLTTGTGHYSKPSRPSLR